MTDDLPPNWLPTISISAPGFLLPRRVFLPLHEWRTGLARVDKQWMGFNIHTKKFLSKQVNFIRHRRRLRLRTETPLESGINVQITPVNFDRKGFSC